ncbi:MAG: cytochrome c biogenesis protein CcdA, partial [Aquirufa sp.]
MKLKYIAFLLFAFLAIPAVAQKITPAKWSWSIKPANPKVGEQAEVIFKVAIEKDWYLYSSDFDKDLGPTVTTVTFKPGVGYQTIGGLKAINPHSKNDTEIWNGTYTYFTGQGEFRQKIKITAPEYKIEGSYDSQSCSNVSGLCVPIKGVFSLAGKAEKAVVADTAATAPVTVDSVAEAPVAKSAPVAPTAPSAQAPQEESLFTFFWIALGAGFLALLTPCVYPLIPMTVSFFTKQKGGKGLAFLYGGFIVLIYVFFGTLLAFFAGASFANFLSTHWIPNMLFFTIFILFGISFLGAFEIVLPSNLVNSVDAKSDKGGFIGVFFMAFTLVLVSFSCTGPLAGSILIAASQGAFLKPIIGMLGFS